MATISPNAPTALVTGANRGIGLGFAQQLKQQGYNVIGTARSDKAEDVAELRQAAYLVVPLDISNVESINSFAGRLAAANVKQIDLLVANAGVGAFEPLDQVTAESLLSVFTTNAMGPLLVTKSLLPLLRASKAAGQTTKIVHMSSPAGSLTLNSPGGPYVGGAYAYRGSKAALNAYTKSLAEDLRKEDIITVLMNPGQVNTHGRGGLSVEESVAAQLKVISGLKSDDTSKFFDLHGRIVPW
ncbi:hypothetical protein RI367_003103 [Sorochytrium milnesiophthora]